MYCYDVDDGYGDDDDDDDNGYDDDGKDDNGYDDDGNDVCSSPKYRTSDIYRCIKHACRILDSY